MLDRLRVYSPPSFVMKLFPEFVWECSNEKILFTFDDGPNPETTPIILKTLADKRIKAVFFLVGQNIERYKSLASETISEGHEIANHTYSHYDVWGLNRKKINFEIKKCSQLIEEVQGKPPRMFRPPHNRFDLWTAATSHKNNLKCVIWSLLTYDYKNDLNIVKFAGERYIAKNSVVVLHDSIKSKDIIVDSINFLADQIEHREFQIGKPSECLN
ncbi:MAG: polysaccharide deacetylase family protein [Melioribacteraceae bacterium]|nr:polysaccharide deacetylase family protein [Melioribacteraceae bacterium]MDD3557808.1 polysaccharide deacetylase family protein [Melioribacteraceae bacterium]